MNLNLALVDILFILIIIVGFIGVGLYFFVRWSSAKLSEQQSLLAANNQSLSLYVIDKKRGKPSDSGLPKAVVEQMPKRAKFMKMYFVKAKVGPQIMTFMCDKKVYNALPIKKNVAVEASGIYITNMKGMKSDEEMKAKKKKK